MHPSEQLSLRALRLLHDGQRHEEQALRWAESLTGQRYPDEIAFAHQVPDAALRGFTLRELSLGAVQW